MLNARSRIRQHHLIQLKGGILLMTWREACPFSTLIKYWPVLINRYPPDYTQWNTQWKPVNNWKRREKLWPEHDLHEFAALLRCCIFFNTFCVFFSNTQSLLLVTFCSCLESHPDALSYDEVLCERPSIHRVSMAPCCVCVSRVCEHISSPAPESEPQGETSCSVI